MFCVSYSTFRRAVKPKLRLSYSTLKPKLRLSYSTLKPKLRLSYSALKPKLRLILRLTLFARLLLPVPP